jgi:hypothetical protein
MVSLAICSSGNANLSVDCLSPLDVLLLHHGIKLRKRTPTSSMGWFSLLHLAMRQPRSRQAMTKMNLSTNHYSDIESYWSKRKDFKERTG